MAFLEIQRAHQRAAALAQAHPFMLLRNEALSDGMGHTAAVLMELAAAYKGMGDSEVAHALATAAVRSSRILRETMASLKSHLDSAATKHGHTLPTNALVSLIVESASAASVLRAELTSISTMDVSIDGIGRKAIDIPILPAGMCLPFEIFFNLFKGEYAPALRAIPPISGGEGDGGVAYQMVAEVLSGSFGMQHPDKAWRELSYYAMANLDHSYIAQRWNVQAFPERARHSMSNRHAPHLEGDANATKWLLNAVPNLANFTAPHSSRHPDRIINSHHHNSNRVVAVTVATQENDELKALQRSAQRAGIELLVLGLDLTIDSSEYR